MKKTTHLIGDTYWVRYKSEQVYEHDLFHTVEPSHGVKISEIVERLHEYEDMREQDEHIVLLRVEYHWDYTAMFFDYYRAETDEETEARLLKEQKVKEQQRKKKEARLEKERKEYERLKKKFGDA